MKKVLLILLMVTFCLFEFAGAEEINVNAGAEASQQMYGGTHNNSMIFNSKPADVVTHRSYIQPHAGAEFLFAPRAIYVPDESRPWYEVACFKYAELYTEEELNCFMKRDGDIVQFTGKLLSMGKNTNSVHFLPAMPGGKKNIKLCTVILETPPNGLLEEGIRRAVSIAKIKTGTRRVYVEVRLQLNPQNAGNVLPLGAGSSFIGGTTAWAFAANPQTGKSQSRVYNIYLIKVHAYNDGSVLPLSIKKLPVKNVLKPVFFNGNGLVTNQENAIENNVQWLRKRWQAINDKGLKVRFVGLYLQESNMILAENMAHDVMVQIGYALYRQGIKETELESTFGYNPDMADLQQIKDLKNRNANGAVIIKITNS